MTLARAIGALRPFPTEEAARLRLPHSLTQWFMDARYAISADGAKVTEKVSGETTDGAALVVWSYEMPINSVMIVETHLVGINSDASKVYAVRDTTCWQRATGNAVRQYMINGAPEYARDWHETSATTALTVGISGANATISVTGIAAESWKWQGFIDYTVLRA